MQKMLAGLVFVFGIGSVVACNDSDVSGKGGTDGQGEGANSIVAPPPETGEGGGGGSGEGGGEAGSLSCVADNFCHESSGGNCSCSGTCNGESVRIVCGWATGEPRCYCFVDGVEIGRCTHPNGGYLCGLDTTCCNQFFD
ncbi:hypothetical protein [Polyangium sp. y55x31]|uniref:hypothetical protein n=1 Tax=Polyangium sp. y55x31 TaxID=3042688 RepID=UPI002482CF99|nr:hypothetical protein [Polyangium sp. y55x31]MDI1478542.1 hypothetical protein [Polyangium sp. y55x31]